MLPVVVVPSWKYMYVLEMLEGTGSCERHILLLENCVVT